MEEKFSVSIELMIQKFKDNAKKVQQVASNVAGKIKENMSVNVGGNMFKGIDNESQLLLDKINDIKASLKMADSDSKLFSKTEVLEMRTELEKLENQYTKINQKSNVFSASFNKIKDGMNKSLKSAKRFTLSLFGIQSVYRMLSRASSAYLAQDQETSSKIQSAWIGLGSVFAPLLQTIANFAIKAVSYINVFIKALTGTDFLANAMSKSMNKASKSAGKLSKTLAGFDEITNLDDNAGGASVDTSWIDAFKDVKLDPQLVKYFEDMGKKIKPVIEKIKEFWSKLTDKQKLDLALTSLGLLSMAIAPLLSSAIIITVAVTGVATVLTQLEELKKQYDELTGTQNSVNKSTKDLTDSILQKVDAGELDKDQIKKQIDLTFDRIDGDSKEIDRMAEKLTWYGRLFGLNDKQVEQMQILIDRNRINLDLLKQLNDRGRLDDEQKEKYIETLKKQVEQIELVNGTLNIGSKEYEANKKEVTNLKTEIEKLTGKKYSTDAEIIAKFDTKQAQKNSLNFFEKLGNSFSAILDPTNWGKGLLKKIWSYDVGTDYVPNNQLASIHEGEKIIPKKFNSDEYVRKSDYNNNAKLESLLEELIDTLDRKDMNAYISESSIGKASQNYRNLQSRIIGEELN